MGKNNGVWKQHLPKKRAEASRIARKDDAIVGPRESYCGVTAYAGRTDQRYLCGRCGNYHDEAR